MKVDQESMSIKFTNNESGYSKQLKLTDNFKSKDIYAFVCMKEKGDSVEVIWWSHNVIKSRKLNSIEAWQFLHVNDAGCVAFLHIVADRTQRKDGLVSLIDCALATRL